MNTPETDLALQEARLRQKFLGLAEPVLGARARRRAARALTELDAARPVRELMRAARPAPGTLARQPRRASGG